MDKTLTESESFKALQKIWYKKLEESGFEEIEDTDSPREFLKTWHSSYFHRKYTPETFEWKQDYYRRASHFLHEYPFESETDRLIWEHHTNGLSLRSTSQELKKNGIRMNKDAIHQVMKELLILMRTFPLEDESTERE